MRLAFSCGAALQGPQRGHHRPAPRGIMGLRPCEGALGRCTGSSERGDGCPSRQASGLCLGVAVANHCTANTTHPAHGHLRATRAPRGGTG